MLINGIGGPWFYTKYNPEETLQENLDVYCELIRQWYVVGAGPKAVQQYFTPKVIDKRSDKEVDYDSVRSELGIKEIQNIHVMFMDWVNGMDFFKSIEYRDGEIWGKAQKVLDRFFKRCVDLPNPDSLGYKVLEAISKGEEAEFTPYPPYYPSYVENKEAVEVEGHAAAFTNDDSDSIDPIAKGIMDMNLINPSTTFTYEQAKELARKFLFSVNAPITE